MPQGLKPRQKDLWHTDITVKRQKISTFLLKNLHMSDFCCTFAAQKFLKQRKEAIMLGFSASNGVEIKGRYARKMRAEALRRESGNLNKHDKQVIQFLQEQPKVTLVREY